MRFTRNAQLVEAYGFRVNLLRCVLICQLLGSSVSIINSYLLALEIEPTGRESIKITFNLTK
jgi:hypothetical protein